MTSTFRAAVLALATLSVFTGCPADKAASTVSTPKKLTVGRSASEIPANGTSTAVITVAGGTSGNITVTTSKGTLTGGLQSAIITGTSGTVTLTSCDSQTVINCVGAAAINAMDGAGVTGTTSVTFTASEICNNGVDDDGNGLIDCKDTAACPLNVSCDALGKVCAADGTCSRCGGAGGVAETKETSCQDGFDNDCDGDIDCADTDCDGKACTAGAAIGTCTSGGCVCNKTETSETSCGDGVDNDCDGLVDCADPNCAGKLCDTSRGLVCGGSPAACATCQSGQTTELAAQCADGKDNDCDGLTDCDDPDCAGDSCNAFGGVCTPAGSGYTCACPSGLFAETNCADGIDNDCNGKIDCADPNCDLQQCGTTAAFVCESNTCVDGATKYSVALVASRSRLPAISGATSRITVSVQYQGAAAVGQLMDLTVEPAWLGIADPVTVSTDGAGNATFDFIATGDIGIARVVATIHGVGTSGFTEVEMPALGEIRLASVQYGVMGVKHSGYQEQNNLAVELLDMAAQPYPAGLAVRFEHLTLGASALSQPVTPDVPGLCETPWCVGYTAVTDANGIAGVTLYSGTVAGTVPVTASASAGGLPARVFDLPTVAIIGARASGAHLAVVCDPLNVPALAATTCYTSLIDSPFHCTAVLKDRFNNIVGRATSVTFMSEGGAVGQPATTPAYDSTQDPVSQANLGLAREVITTLGNKLPKDVTPHQGASNPYGVASLVRGDPRWEYALNYDDNRCLPGTHNPRDGVVTVVASTPGEEAFFDSNGNGVYDAEPCTDLDGDGVWCEAGEYTDLNGNGRWDSEPFIDLPEPYVDYDDNNTRDLDEPFIDSNGNGRWDPPNGKWDANAKIWTQTRVVFTSGARANPYTDANQNFSRWMTVADAATFPASTATPAITLSAATTPFVDVMVGVTDDNFNPIAGGSSLRVWISGDTATYDGYYGATATSDTLGFTFVYWPCDASDPTFTRCANDCAYAASPPPARCVMRSVLRGFQYGYKAPVRIRSDLGPGSYTFLFGAGDLIVPQTVTLTP